MVVARTVRIDGTLAGLQDPVLFKAPRIQQQITYNEDRKLDYRMAEYPQ